MSDSTAQLFVETHLVRGIQTEVVHGGHGAPILVLHGFHNLPADSRFLRELAAYGEVFAPSLPGFGHTARPEYLDSIYDLVHFCMDFADQMPGGQLSVVGLSFGGWLALELATKNSSRLAGLVLVDSLGLKFSDRETPDIADIFNLHPDEVCRRSWHDAAKGSLDFDAMTDDEIIVYARNRESLCLYGWHPYMYSPQLAHWLHRVDAPTLVLWGEDDEVVDTRYGRELSSRLPTASFKLITGAGHHPEIEQPLALVEQMAPLLKAQPET